MNLSLPCLIIGIFTLIIGIIIDVVVLSPEQRGYTCTGNIVDRRVYKCKTSKSIQMSYTVRFYNQSMPCDTVVVHRHINCQRNNITIHETETVRFTTELQNFFEISFVMLSFVLVLICVNIAYNRRRLNDRKPLLPK